MKNGELLAAAESNDFKIFITTDTNLQYQQNLSHRKIAIVVLSTTSWPRIKSHLSGVLDAIEKATPNAFLEVDIPFIS
ncbi:hypothetical protein [Polynucleobacter antarcticus]|uniref:hypothetical protein n=1 Tax=Polynucleobacter antarcticus TaxID=1743162 RepID=UPI001C2D1E57|nr:hypothetical protein [Polynucleobacter antarcticus]